MGYGDDLMVTGEARIAREKDSRKVAVLRRPGQYRWSEVFDNNPNFATLAELHSPFNSPQNVQVLDDNAGRRYRASETPERRVWTAIGPTRGDLYFTEAERAWAAARARDLREATPPNTNPRGFVVVEPNLKPRAGVNKDWGFERWQALLRLMPSVPWVQMGRPGVPVLAGARFVATETFRQAAALLVHATAAVLPEGGLHHAAAIVGVRAVVIFGGYISPVQTGYPEHVNLFTGDPRGPAPEGWRGGSGAGEQWGPCGWRVPCEHCAAAMAAITPETVRDALASILFPRAADAERNREPAGLAGGGGRAAE
jgi:hypothetical protein